MTTSFENKTIILADLWLNFRNDDEFQYFVSYNDLGLPLAYAISEEIVKTTDIATNFVNETFSLLLAGLGIEEDIGFGSMEDLFAQAELDKE
jgi:hypothetical protein